MNINTVVVTKLYLGWWYGNHKATGLENKLAADQNGKAEAFKVRVSCMPKEHYDRIAAVTREAWKIWITATMPYQDGGWRLMRADKYEALLVRINELAAKRRDAVDELISHYDEVVVHAKNAAGKAWREGFIPPRDILRSKFVTWLRAAPVQNPDDIRLQVDPNTLATITEQVRAQLAEAESEMRNEVKNELGHFLSEIVKKLQMSKNEAKGARYACMLTCLGKTAKRFREIGLFEEHDSLLAEIESVVDIKPKVIKKSIMVRRRLADDLIKLNDKVEEAFA